MMMCYVIYYNNIIKTSSMSTVELEKQDETSAMSLGARMKTYEKEQNIPFDNYILIRVDGKNFSKFTGKFNKPFDVRFTKAMIWTLNDMINEFNISLGFCCSDEITFVIPKRSEESGHDFGGRVHKMNSLYAGKCSVFFLLNVLRAIQGTENSEELRAHIINSAPCFDSRIMEFSEELKHEIVNNIYWRSVHDCFRNCVSSVGRFVLGKKATHKLNSSTMIEQMKTKYQFDFVDNVHYCLQYGVYAKKCSVTLTNEDGEKYTRHHIKNFTMKLQTGEEIGDFIFKKYCELNEWERFEGKYLSTESLEYYFDKEK